MFKLQRLEITGFKSFADYTEVIFTGSGITAVVGPNGCGKSNVSDCIAWVLGEQRAKSLRGEEMKDVIFQGTSKRQPGGMAEVVLHLVRDDSEINYEEEELEDIDASLSEIDENAVDVDALEEVEEEDEEAEAVNAEAQTNGFHAPDSANGFHVEEAETMEQAQAAQVGSVQTVQKKIKTKRHWKPRSFALDFAPGEAVSVGRRLYRSGESEYLLNGKSCRLRDIQDLFAGTGLSGAHYALIEQGKIGQILSSKPSDRRNLIEEAAGISKFRTRQRAAETRLESAKTNLSRITDIVAEIEKQANSLRRQASKTRRYKILREEFRQLLRQTFAAEGSHLSALVDELETDLSEAVKAERRVLRQVAEKDEAFREATNRAREAEENLSDLRARHSENALERDRNLRERGYQTEQIANLKQRSAVLKSETESSERRLKLTESEIKRLEKEEQKERAEAEKNESALTEAEAKYESEVSRLEEIEAELENERSEVLQHTAAFERLTEIERQLENTIERLKERAEGLRREGERAKETFNEHKKQAEKLEKALDKERRKLEDLHTEKQQILVKTGEAREILKESEGHLSDLREEFSRKTHRLETLQELEEKRAIYAPAVQKLFAAEKKIGVKFRGTLADRLSVDEKLEPAIESLFGGFLQTVLVESEKDARRVASFLGENNIGRNSLLVVEEKGGKAKEKKAKNKDADIAGLMGLSDQLAGVLREIFPREMSARVVSGLDQVKSKTDQIFVTFDGDLIIGGKLFVSGKHKENEKNTSLLAFKRELRQLKSDAGKLTGRIEKAKKKAEEARRTLAGQEDKLIDLQSFIVKVERELLSQEIQAKSLAQEKERAERHKKVVAEETRQIETELSEIQNRQKEARINAGKAEKARVAASKNLEKITKKLNQARFLAETENKTLNEKRTLAATSAERRRAVQSALRRVENEEKELTGRIEREKLESREIEGKLKELTGLVVEIESRIESARDEQENEQDELSEALGHLKLTREKADEMSDELAELNKQSAEARNERAGLEIRQTEAVTRLRSLNEKCAQELSLSLVELVENEEVPEDFELEESKTGVDELRHKLENFGAINMLALEELSEAEERLLFLTSQRQDIIDSITAAEEALREIKRRSREKFREAFEAINENFREFFQELFGGGRGEMTLLEAEDILEAGIEIVAQPPGKRLQNILLLSGGEKAMTAIALVLGIFRYRPSPFCLLDEVDAPLDDANVGRFVNKIAEMAEKTQFIVITHNKRTMEAARALYGVTMQEAGVSKLVSVRFE
ncbi:MAG: chromosome segregation protein SMC [Pyrinomonadaceae bacterium]